MVKQVIIMRTDLNMRKGKMIAQGSHASMKIFFDRMKKEYDTTILLCNGFECTFTYNMIEWMKGSFTKIVVGCNSEEELLELKKQADEADIVNAIILDNGQTEFRDNCPKCFGIKYEAIPFELDNPIICTQCNGTGKVNKPTYTCLAIGPDQSEVIDKITRRLRLL
jgi:peptidyl-tRNA hydrolase, PTH2 family